MSKFDLKKSYQPKPFLDLRVPEDGTFDDAQAVVVPFGYEGTVTFGHGTDKGPAGLIEASYQVETFDDELLDDVQNQIKLWTTKQPQIPKDPKEACKVLSDIVEEIIKANKFPIVIGGEHTISYGFASALAKHYSDVSILVFDSHMDLGDRSSGRDFSHAAWLKYSLNDFPSAMQTATLLGIRNFNKMEWEYWKDNMDRVRVFQAKEKKTWNTEAILQTLKSNVYLSFDIDAFDSSVMPSTGTPEPGGLFWDDVLPILKAVAAEKNIIGMDVVELAPIKGMQAPDFVAAKLLMKMLLYKFKAKQLTGKAHGEI
ncbi:MAG: agmatinase [Candidatus Doudnabacteria bacterium]|nr:agmatinase [Candidatus Doudnabacteria bacterium]